MYKYTLISLALTFSLPAVKAQDQHQQLRADIKQIASTSKGILGVSILSIEDQDTLNYNGNARLVMQSVFKFPIGMTVLHLADQGKISLDKKIKIKKKDYFNAYSPLKDKYPDGTEITIWELVEYMVSSSDNVACDVLLKTIGGPEIVENYIFSLRVKGISIRASEAEMAASWEVQYTDWCKPAEMTRLLEILYWGKALSKSNNDLLIKLMTDSTVHNDRIKGLLPAGTIVAHKTGSSGTNDAKLSPATNDVGIIIMPNGKHLAISIFLCNSTADEATRDMVIAKVAKAAYDEFNRSR